MSKFLEWMRNELESRRAADVESPRQEVRPGEKVIGVLTDPEVRKLWALLGDLQGQALARATEVCSQTMKTASEGGEIPGHDPSTCELCQAYARLRRVVNTGDTIKVIFWAALRHELSEEARIKLDVVAAAGIRKDWQIVAIPEPQPPALPFGLGVSFPLS